MITVRIDRRFRGPPDSANGGYVAGVLAKQLGGSDVVVTLRQPAPLDTDLTIDASRDAATLSQDDRIIAVAERQTVTIDVPAPPSIAQAGEAEQRFDGGAHL